MPSIIKIADLVEITDPVEGCWLPIVDVSEPLEVNQTKKIKVANVKSTTATILAAAYPIGSLFLSAVSTNPATLLGIGTWTAFGAGKMPVGYDATQTEFNTAEKTGGEKDHTLTESEMPTHTHTQNSHNHTQDAHAHTMNNQLWHVATGTAAWAFSDTGSGVTGNTAATNQAATATNQNAGSGAAYNTLPPYITVFMWKRTA